MGKPNVGKSTLINTLLGQKIAAVSPRPQTTRKRQLGILTLEQAQLIFVDTPGIHQPRHKLGEFMVQEAAEILPDCDLIWMMVNASLSPDDDDRRLAELIASLESAPPVFLLLNFIDKLDPDLIPERQAAFAGLAPEATPFAISALYGNGLEQLIAASIEKLPEGSPLYSEDQITDLYERDIAADLIREAALNLLDEEVPHGIAVRIDQYRERGDSGAYIEATLFVEKESHKGIVIGKGGAMIKKIGSAARQQIEAMSGRKVYLELRVKVQKNWRNNEKILRRFMYRVSHTPLTIEQENDRADSERL